MFRVNYLPLSTFGIFFLVSHCFYEPKSDSSFGIALNLENGVRISDYSESSRNTFNICSGPFRILCVSRLFGSYSFVCDESSTWKTNLSRKKFALQLSTVPNFREMKYAYSYLLLTLFWPREDGWYWYLIQGGTKILKEELVNIPKLTDLTKPTVLRTFL